MANMRSTGDGRSASARKRVLAPIVQESTPAIIARKLHEPSPTVVFRLVRS